MRALTLFLLAGCSHHGEAEPPSSVEISAVTYNALFVVNGADSTISVIDTEANVVRSTIQLENAPFPHHINLSPDHTQLVVAVPGTNFSGGHGGGHGGHSGAGALMTLDAETGATRSTAALAAPSHNGIFTSDGSEIWAGQMKTTGEVLVLEPTSLTPITTLSVGGFPAEVTLSATGHVRSWPTRSPTMSAFTTSKRRCCSRRFPSARTQSVPGRVPTV